jgi:hypothetical protein
MGARAALAILVVASVASVAPAGVTMQPASATISVNPSKTYQTFSGWETVFLSSIHDYTRVLPAYDAVLDEAVNDLGITRALIGISSGTEHPPGNGEKFLAGLIDEDDYFEHYAYNIINDNSNAKVANLDGFDFALIDWRMEHLVVPMKRRVEARGDQFYLYLSYVDFGKSKFEHWDHPEEYAEFMLVLFDRLKTKYGVVPSGINIINEPDHNTEWNADLIGDAVAKTGPRLAAAGYHPDFIVASAVDRAHAVPLFEAARAVRGAKQYITDLSYHCYADSTPRNDSLPWIGEAAVRYGVRTMMNECWTPANTYEWLHRDLKEARTSAWQQGALAGPNGYYRIDRPTMRPIMNDKTKIMRQYYRYIRPGARRIEAASSDGAFDPLAFISASGAYVVVVKAASGGSFTIDQLPAGTYDVSYSTESEYDHHAPNVTLTAGQTLTATIPRNGVATVSAIPAK